MKPDAGTNLARVEAEAPSTPYHGGERRARGAPRWQRLLAALRYGSANFLLLLGCLSLVLRGFAPWIVLAFAMAVGSFADEAAGDDRSSIKDATCIFCDLNLYASLPLVALLGVLLVRFAGDSDVTTFELIGAIWLTGYLFALVGATVAHELTHRKGTLPQLSAHALLGFTYNPSFVIYHVYGHHRNVGTYDDASTARRGERLRTFIRRAIVDQYTQAAEIEAAHLRRKRRSYWSWRNRLHAAILPSILILLAAWLIGGWTGLWVIIAAGVVGRLFHELINYVQHFGLVRVEGTPIRPHHSWDCYRTISNALHYNLPRHSDHHMFAGKAFWQLDAEERAPTLPFGYQTMALIALTPPLWRYMMRKLLADWDARFASEQERALVRERGWEGLA